MSSPELYDPNRGNRGLGPVGGGLSAPGDRRDESGRVPGDQYRAPTRSSGFRERLRLGDIYSMVGHEYPARGSLDCAYDRAAAPGRISAWKRFINEHHYDNAFYRLSTLGALIGIVWGVSNIDAIPGPADTRKPPAQTTEIGAGSTFSAIMNIEGDPNPAILVGNNYDRVIQFVQEFNGGTERRAALIQNLNAYSADNLSKDPNNTEFKERYDLLVRQLENCPANNDFDDCLYALPLDLPDEFRHLFDVDGDVSKLETPAPVSVAARGGEFRKVRAEAQYREKARYESARAQSVNQNPRNARRIRR